MILEQKIYCIFDVRVTRVNSKGHQSKTTEDVFKEQKEKKRKYQQRVLDVEIGSFTHLVFGTKGGMGSECTQLFKPLASKLSLKKGEPYSTVIAWLRTAVSFEIIRFAHACVKGSRVPFCKDQSFFDD